MTCNRYLLGIIILVNVLQCAGASLVSYEQNCLSRGFDPSVLSCKTCELLTKYDSFRPFYDECKECCQEEYGRSSESDLLNGDKCDKAEIVVSTAALEMTAPELKSFLEEDLGSLESKYKIHVQLEQMDPQTMMRMIYGGGGNLDKKSLIPKLMLYSNESLIEEIELIGWSRDDIKELVLGMMIEKN